MPLMTRTIENGFQLTGPIARGDWSVVDAHLGALHDAHPELEPMYRVLRGGDRAVKITRTIAETRAALPGAETSASCRRWARTTPGHVSLFSAARAESETVVASLFVNPAQFGRRRRSRALPARRGSGRRGRRGGRASTCSSRPPPRSSTRPGFETWVDVEQRLPRARGRRSGPGHFRGVATICLKLFNIVRPRRAYFGQKDAQQVEVIRRMIRDLDLEIDLRVAPDRARRRRPRALLAERAAF